MKSAWAMHELCSSDIKVHLEATMFSFSEEQSMWNVYATGEYVIYSRVSLLEIAIH